MYGSKEVLVNEYRVMLADRLLAKQDYNTATDVRTLELLKVRRARWKGGRDCLEQACICLGLGQRTGASVWVNQAADGARVAQGFRMAEKVLRKESAAQSASERRALHAGWVIAVRPSTLAVVFHYVVFYHNPEPALSVARSSALRTPTSTSVTSCSRTWPTASASTRSSTHRRRAPRLPLPRTQGRTPAAPLKHRVPPDGSRPRRAGAPDGVSPSRHCPCLHGEK